MHLSLNHWQDLFPPPKSAQALFVVSSIFNVNLWLKRCSFNGSSKKHKHHHSVCHKVSSFTWAVCLFKDSPCRHTLDLNRGGCHVDSRQPGTFCSVLVRALVFYTSLCAFFFFFDKQPLRKLADIILKPLYVGGKISAEIWAAAAGCRRRLIASRASKKPHSCNHDALCCTLFAVLCAACDV